MVARAVMELREEMIAKIENGVHVSDVTPQYSMTRSMILTFSANKGAMVENDVGEAVTSVLTQQRSLIMGQVEKILIIFHVIHYCLTLQKSRLSMIFFSQIALHD